MSATAPFVVRTALERFAALAARVPDTEGLVALTIPAPRVPATTLWTISAEPASAFARPNRLELAGLGVTERIAVDGGGFGAALDAARRALRATRVLAAGAERLAGPAALGGAAFDPATCDGPWEELGAGVLVVPRWLYRRDGERASVTFTFAPRREAWSIDGLCASAHPVLASLESADAMRESPAPRIVERHDTPLASYGAAVDRARALIAEGALEKVVVARRTWLRAARPFDAASVLSTLHLEAPDTAIFGIREGKSSFVGASPELLLESDGASARSEALAGTAFREPGDEGARRAADALLASAKDRHEHAHVADAIAAIYRELCHDTEVPDAPRARMLRRLVHLGTPIRGTLAAGVTPGRLVDALHPTPAVCGVPRQAAVEFIREHEPDPRGWYAGPFGAVHADGRIDVAVALRSGLVRGDEAHLYAGAGIVAASRAASEYEETASKLRSMLDALGVVPDESRE